MSHPCEFKACAACGVESWLQVRRDFCSYKCSKTGANNPLWKGAGAGYVSKHARVYRLRGKADHCERCGSKGGSKYEWANLTGDYGDIHDYEQMCPRCHRRYDNARKPNKGRTVYTDELLDRAEEMRKTMTLKAVAEELGVQKSNLSTYLGKRRA
jgi:hypothetical protein